MPDSTITHLRPVGGSTNREAPSWEDRLDCTATGMRRPTHSNVLTILRHDPALAGLVAFDAFTLRHLLLRGAPVVDDAIPACPGPFPRPWADDDLVRVLAYLQRRWAHGIKLATVAECLEAEARTCVRHDVRSYLYALEWDRCGRIEEWLTRTFGCPLDDYHRAVGGKFLIAAVRRVRQPGCKFDFLPVLEGAQGIGKSRAIVTLFGQDWTTDQIADLSKKDAAIDLAGKWAVELAEVEHLIRNDVETVKAFLSRAVDHYRPPYGRTSVDVPRQSVLIGTTNEREYLRDTTGNRRIWPVDCFSTKAADLKWLAENRNQLWAEAAARELGRETIWLEGGRLASSAAETQHLRLQQDPWTEKVQAYVAKRPSVSVPDLLEHAVYVRTEQQTKSHQMRIADILRSLGWSRHTTWDVESGKAVKSWQPPEGGEDD